MVLRDSCILYEVCLLKVPFIFLLVFQVMVVATFWSSTWVLQMAMYYVAACLFSSLCFYCLKILCEDKSRGYNIMHCKTPKIGEMVKVHFSSIGRL